MSANMVNALAREYARQRNHESAVQLLGSFIVRREADVNDHLLELASLQMARSLEHLERRNEAMDVLAYAIRQYEGSWEDRLVRARSKLTREAGLSRYIHVVFGALNASIHRLAQRA